MNDRERETRRMIRNFNLAGLATIGILIGGIGGWAATAQLSGAVIAPGSIVVESNLKRVQHPTGGVVGHILVKEGDTVEEGQVVVRLDETVPRAMLGIVRSQLDELVARQTRLLAERDGSENLAFPQDLTRRRSESGLGAAMAGEEKLFEARRSARTGQRSQLRERLAQINEEIQGLSAQRMAKANEIDLIAQELKGVAELYEKKLVSIVRYMALQRDQQKLQGDHGQLGADIARARARTAETELQIIQLDQDFRTEVLKDLRDAEGKIGELRERLTAAEDQLQRVEIRAPQAGIVHQLAVHTIGGVIKPGDTILSIVPRLDELIVEARVAPQDIDQIAIGAPVAVRIMAGNQRTTPTVAGVLIHVSADLTREPASGTQVSQAYFLVRVSLPKESVKQLGDLRLVPGMPAEAFIETGTRTPLDYLIRPLQEQIARTFRER